MIATPSRERVQELIAAGNAGRAASEAIKAVGPHVLRYLESILQDDGDLADAFSVFAEAVWKGLPGFRWESSLTTWAYHPAHHAALRVRDQPWRRRGRRLETTEASLLADSVRTKTFIRAERQREGLEKLITVLPVEDQSLLALRIGQGLEWSEIAAVMTREGTPVNANTIAKRFSRLKERLSRMAREQGLVE
jgi:RNA polymerase sigma-70 factor, ECF subfamily